MGDRLGPTTTSLPLNVDPCSPFYSLHPDDNSPFEPPLALSTTTDDKASNLAVANTLCMLVNGRPIQQRYKLINDGPLQVCRVPHAKNIIEKIRFSRFLRRWEDHYLTLGHNEISSNTVRFLFDLFSM